MPKSRRFLSEPSSGPKTICCSFDELTDGAFKEVSIHALKMSRKILICNTPLYINMKSKETR
jgi:hypothetical protein